MLLYHMGGTPCRIILHETRPSQQSGPEMTFRRAERKEKGHGGGSLTGQLLLAMPLMADRRFARSVIYMCAHSEEGAMGLIINQRAPQIDFAGLFQRLGIEGAALGEELRRRPVQIGGPVEPSRGFVLHTSDYFSEDLTLPVADGICLTATVDVLKAIAEGTGPRQMLLALGYAGWAAGQLESEIQANGWLHGPADPSLVFDSDLEKKYARALAHLGIDLSHLVSGAGHA